MIYLRVKHIKNQTDARFQQVENCSKIGKILKLIKSENYSPQSFLNHVYENNDKRDIG